MVQTPIIMKVAADVPARLHGGNAQQVEVVGLDYTLHLDIGKLPVSSAPVPVAEWTVVWDAENNIYKRFNLAQLSAGINNESHDFDVKKFGAVGDGVTDDTAAIRATLAALNANGGGELYFPHGHYAVKGGVDDTAIFNLTTPIHVIGEGASTSGSWIDAQAGTPATCDVFRWAPQVYSFFYSMRDMMVFSPGGYGRDALTIYTEASAAHDWLIEHAVIERCWLWGARYGIYQDAANADGHTGTIHQFIIKASKFSGGVSPASPGGCVKFLKMGDSLTLEDIGLSGYGFGVDITPTSGAAQQVLSRLNLRVMAGIGIRLKSCSQAKIRDSQLEQGLPSTATENALIVLDGCDGIEITGSNLHGLGNCAKVVYVTGGTIDTRARDNTISNGANFHVAFSATAGGANSFDLTNDFQPSASIQNLSTVFQMGPKFALTLLNSFTNVGGSFATLGLVRTSDGFTNLEGTLTCPASPSGKVIANIPVGCCPANNRRFSIAAVNGVGVALPAFVEVATGGNITLTTDNAATQIDLAGVIFRVAGSPSLRVAKSPDGSPA